MINTLTKVLLLNVRIRILVPIAGKLTFLLEFIMTFLAVPPNVTSPFNVKSPLNAPPASGK